MENTIVLTPATLLAMYVELDDAASAAGLKHKHCTIVQQILAAPLDAVRLIYSMVQNTQCLSAATLAKNPASRVPPARWSPQATTLLSARSAAKAASVATTCSQDKG